MLFRSPIEALLVKEVKGFGRQKNMLDQYSAQDFELAFLPKVEITLWVEESRLDEVLQIVEEASRTGRMGDGKIFVVQAEEEVPPS